MCINWRKVEKDMEKEKGFFERHLAPELVERLKTDPSAAAEVTKWMQDLQAHHNNPVYIEAREFFGRVQREQIDKGARKYPEPLNPLSWTVGELVHHAMMELVDQAHYITSIDAKSEGLRANMQSAISLLEDAVEGGAGGKETAYRALDMLREVARQL